MYKTQIACAIVLIFIGAFNYFTKKEKSKSSKCFSVLLWISFFQLVFDVFSVYTVNHLETVSPVLNRIIHIFYMGLLLAIFYMAYKYLEIIIEEEIGEKFRQSGFTTVPLVITMAGVVFLPLEYIENPKSNYSFGPAAFMTYIGVAVYVVLIVRLMRQYGNEIPIKKKSAIMIALLSEIPIAVYQILIPEALITCLGIVLLNLGIYLTTENPDALLVEQLEKETKRADNANKAKTNFLANMSHEIRTPITAVLGMNEMILRETKEEDIRGYASDVQGAAKSLLSIINDILDITKIEAGKLSVISAEYDFSSVIHDVTNMISFKAKIKELDFKVNIDETIPGRLMGDDIRLRQILVNILNNAVKYTEKGSVILEIKQLPCEKEGITKLIFQVKDTGIGIKEEDLKKLCEPFARLEEKRNRNIEGTGLGMSITKQLLNLLHSELRVQSVYGEGSIFSFELEQEIVDMSPIGKLDARLESENSEYYYQSSFEAPEAKILVVDDNDMNRKVFIGLLKETRIQIEEANSGKVCLEKVKEKAYDIIFMDHMMPEMDGVETFKIMQTMGEYPSKNAPVVILTANAIAGAKEQYLAEGFSEYLAKPIDHKKLEKLLAAMLDASLVKKKTPVKEKDAALKTTEKSEEEYPVVEGLDWRYAECNFPDREMVLEAVRMFAESLAYGAKELEHLYEDIDTLQGQKAYCTQVHSMKSSAATVGIVPLAGMAKVLEDAARNGELEVLHAMTPIFLERWRSYEGHLTMFLKTDAGEDKKLAAEHADKIMDILKSMESAAEDMDIDALDELWKQLEVYQFETTQQEEIERIHEAVINFDVDYLEKCSLFLQNIVY